LFISLILKIKKRNNSGNPSKNAPIGKITRNYLTGQRDLDSSTSLHYSPDYRHQKKSCTDSTGCSKQGFWVTNRACSAVNGAGELSLRGIHQKTAATHKYTRRAWLSARHTSAARHIEF
jgi:hypothetical protein